MMRSLDRQTHQAILDGLMTTYYQQVPWGEQIWQEQNPIRSDYQPYTVWRAVPVSGITTNVSADGWRVTPGAACGPDALTVFVFGGSTMWGFGAPDWGTIPAYLQAQLSAERDQPVCVQNFGQMGFVSTQEVIELELQLQQGHVPDWVIFYDGVNDVVATYQNGRSGIHLNADYTAQQLSSHGSFGAWVRQTASFRFLVYLQGRMGSRLGIAPAPPVKPPATETAVLQTATIQTYFANYELVQALAVRYGFQAEFFWQPMLVTSHKVLTPEEQQGLDNFDPPLNAFYESIYAEMAQTATASTAPNHWHNLADTLDQETQFLWIDQFHLVPQGNELMAEAILRSITIK